MIYVSIDIETCGLDADKHSVIEFGAIIEDTTKQLPFEIIPKFNRLLKYPDGNYTGNPFALAMHKEIFTEINQKKNLIQIYSLGKEFDKFLRDNLSVQFLAQNIIDNETDEYPINRIKINVAGKNFANFDLKFLNNVPDFNKYILINHRIIDPSTLYFNEDIDEELPNLSQCKVRAGIEDESIAHRTIQDAFDVICVLRGKMYKAL